MKKMMSYIAVVALVLTFTACGNKDNEVVNNNPPVNSETNIENNNETENKENEVNNEQVNNEGNTIVENKPAENKPEENKKPAESKPAENKPVENKPAEEKPVENKPVEELPVEKPQETTKQEEPVTSSVGNILLNDFKSKAATATNMQALGEALVNNPIVPKEMSKMSIEVTEGYLAGLGEIKGFKSGAMFGPSISTIPFIGYVFELENEASVADFVKILKDNADLSWNWCTTAEEAVFGSEGNKVFVVMGPISFEG